MISEYIKNLKNVEKDIEPFVKRCLNDKKGAILEVFQSWRDQAKRIDEKIKAKKPLGKLAGVPVIIKDNILFKGHKMGSSSKILDGFVSPYNATVIEKLIAEDAVIIARSNMDEFAMGVGRYTKGGPTKNAHSDDHTAGGSSSGSAVAVALDYCLVALGTDTAGSVRLPAAYNKVVGMKPTYGSVSRYGVTGFGSSIEQVGIITKTVQDNKLVMDIISGKCSKDATTKDRQPSKQRPKQLKVGRVKEIFEASKQELDIFEKLRKRGAEIIDISIPNIAKSINCYYALGPVHGSSNLTRFDGVRFGSSADAESVNELYIKTRSNGFGDEVKRRILLGNYIMLESQKAGQSVKEQIEQSFTKVFKKVDILVFPTTAGDAPRLDARHDPVSDYLVDLFTVPMNLSGSPAVSVPHGHGIQIIADKWNEDLMFTIAKEVTDEL